MLKLQGHGRSRESARGPLSRDRAPAVRSPPLASVQRSVALPESAAEYEPPAPAAAPPAPPPPPPLQPPPGSVMAGWGMAGGQPRMNPVYRLIRMKELQSHHPSHQPGARQPPPVQQKRRSSSDPWGPDGPTAGSAGGWGPGGPPRAQARPAASTADPRPGTAHSRGAHGPSLSPSLPPEPRQPSVRARAGPPEPFVPRAGSSGRAEEPWPGSPPEPLRSTGHAAVDRVVRIRQIQIHRRRRQAQDQAGGRAAEAAEGGAREAHPAWRPEGAWDQAPPLSPPQGPLGRGSGAGQAQAQARARALAGEPEDGAGPRPPPAGGLIQVTLAPEVPAAGDDLLGAAGVDARSARGGAGSGGSGVSRTTSGMGAGVGAEGGSSSLLREALMSDLARMNPVYRMIRKHELRQRRPGPGGTRPGASGGSAAPAAGPASPGASAASYSSGPSPTASLEPWAGDDFADVMLGGLLLPGSGPGPVAGPAAGPLLESGSPPGTRAPRLVTGGWKREQEEQGARREQEEQGARREQEEQGARREQEEQGARREQEEQGARREQEEQGARREQEEQGARREQEEQGARREQEEQGARREQEEQGARREQEEQGARREQEEQGARREQAGRSGASGAHAQQPTAREEPGPGPAADGLADGEAGQELSRGSGLNPVTRLIRKKQLQRRLRLSGRLALEPPPARAADADGDAGPGRRGGGTGAAGAEEAEAQGEAGSGDGGWEIGPEDAVGGRAVLNPVYRLIRKKQLQQRRASRAASTASASSSTDEAAFLQLPSAPSVASLGGLRAPFFDLGWGLDPSSSPTSPPASGRPSLADALDPMASAMLPDPQFQGSVEIRLDPSPRNLGRLEGQPRSASDAPAGPSPLPSALLGPGPRPLVSDDLAASLVGERSRMNHVYRLIRKKELQLRQRAAAAAAAAATADPGGGGLSAAGAAGPGLPSGYPAGPGGLQAPQGRGSGLELPAGWRGSGAPQPAVVLHPFELDVDVDVPYGTQALYGAAQGSWDDARSAVAAGRVLAGYDRAHPLLLPLGGTLEDGEDEAVEEEEALEAEVGGGRGLEAAGVVDGGTAEEAGAAVSSAVGAVESSLAKPRRRQSQGIVAPAAPQAGGAVDGGSAGPIAARPRGRPRKRQPATEAPELSGEGAAEGSRTEAIAAAAGTGGRRKRHAKTAAEARAAVDKLTGSAAAVAAAAAPGAAAAAGTAAAVLLSRRQRISELKARLRARLLSAAAVGASAAEQAAPRTAPDGAPSSDAWVGVSQAKSPRSSRRETSEPLHQKSPAQSQLQPPSLPAPPSSAAARPRLPAQQPWQPPPGLLRFFEDAGTDPAPPHPHAQRPGGRGAPTLTPGTGAAAVGSARGPGGHEARGAGGGGRGGLAADPRFRGVGELWRALGVRVGPLPPRPAPGRRLESVEEVLEQAGVAASSAALLGGSSVVLSRRWAGGEVMERLGALEQVLGRPPLPVAPATSSAAGPGPAYYSSAGRGGASAVSARVAAAAARQPNLLTRRPQALESNLEALGEALGLDRRAAASLARRWPSLLELRSASLRRRLEGLAGALGLGPGGAAPQALGPTGEARGGDSQGEAGEGEDADAGAIGEALHLAAGVAGAEEALAAAAAVVRAYPPALALTAGAVAARVAALAEAIVASGVCTDAAGVTPASASSPSANASRDGCICAVPKDDLDSVGSSPDPSSCWERSRAASLLVAQPGLLGCSPGLLAARWRALAAAVAEAEAAAQLSPSAAPAAGLAWRRQLAQAPPAAIARCLAASEARLRRLRVLAAATATAHKPRQQRLPRERSLGPSGVAESGGSAEGRAEEAGEGRGRSAAKVEGAGAARALSLSYVLAMSAAKFPVSQGPGSAPSGAAGSAQLPPTATSSATLGEAPVRTGREFALALADGSVGVIRVLSDVTLSDADWEGLATPVPVARNVTVTGPDPERWPLLDMAYVTGKAQLRSNATLQLVGLTLNRFRVKNLGVAPGLDLLAPTPVGERGFVVMVGGLLLTRFCYPPELPLQQFGPPQTMVSQAGCVNDTSARAQDRCWAGRGSWDGMWTGMDEDEPGKRSPNNYDIILNAAGFTCSMVLPLECIQRLGMISCAVFMLTTLQPSPPSPLLLEAPPGSGDGGEGGGGDGGGGGGGGGDMSTGAVVGVALGAAAGLVLLCAAVAVWAWKRRARRGGSGGGQKGVPDAQAIMMTGGTQGQSNGDEEAGGRGEAQPQELPLSKVWVPPSSLERPSSSGTAASEQRDASNGGPQQQVVSPLAPPRPDLVTHVALRPAAAASPRAADRAPEDPMAAAADVVTLLPTILGRGAFGCVHLGTFRGARVAVKVLNGDSALMLAAAVSPPKDQDPSFRSRFILLTLASRPQQAGAAAVAKVDPMPAHAQFNLSTLAAEVEVLGRCDHPNVVRLLAACLAPPRPCLVFELMETNLDRLVYGERVEGEAVVVAKALQAAGEGSGSGRTLPMLSLGTVLHIALQIAQALEYLHPSVVHRDLKPANVLISNPDSPTPVVKLTDFGLARLRAETVATLHPEAGTPAYLAPECYDPANQVVTHHADMYSLGVVVWAMLTGRQPWKGLTIPAVAYKVAVLGERPPLDQVSERRCPQALRLLVMACWDPDPLRRPAAAEAAKGLRSLLDAEGRRARRSMVGRASQEYSSIADLGVAAAPSTPRLPHCGAAAAAAPLSAAELTPAAEPTDAFGNPVHALHGNLQSQEAPRTVAERQNGALFTGAWARLSEPPSRPSTQLEGAGTRPAGGSCPPGPASGGGGCKNAACAAVGTSGGGGGRSLSPMKAREEGTSSRESCTQRSAEYLTPCSASLERPSAATTGLPPSNPAQLSSEEPLALVTGGSGPEAAVAVSAAAAAAGPEPGHGGPRAPIGSRAARLACDLVTRPGWTEAASSALDTSAERETVVETDAETMSEAALERELQGLELEISM
ncbi:hypothetical protein HYH03_017603 [Edaphochlamys debaryana]|uniref:Protein kinase domain-containing protein n=1 Tax=Edaphochlamys debaryana TaxID=47281 RepID=A0A836BQ95_9CHLO|nr:hypothetical protein HYH03_017603 [Edaphochlamys debaryana]|eukprot:KAG2483549.1 hypothetical protein HYH03_017603 [Edaphochlamys debaryana]